MSPRLAVPLLVLLAIAAALLWPRKPRPAARVLLITIDTLRADAVPGPGTPALTAYLATATRFTGARAGVPLTVAAHASMLSGLTAAAHGIHDNTAAILPGRKVPLVAREMKEAGYATAAFVAAGVLGRHTGLDEGFDVYGVPPATAEPYLPAEERLAAPLEWLAQRADDERWFCWVHFFDPHAPYLPYPGDARRAGAAADSSEKERYHGEVRRVDAAVGALLAAVGPDTVVLIAADHGEGLGEHGEPTHGALTYSTTLDAFVAIRARGFARGAVDASPRRLCDIAPTLRRLCGLADQPGDGIPLMDPGPEVAVSECLHVWRQHGWGQCFAASDGRYTLVESGPAVELFDRKDDPGELRPLPLAGDPAYERLDRALNAYRNRTGTGQEFQPDVVTPYGTGRRPDGTYLPRPENARLADPRPRLAWWTRLARVQGEAAMAFSIRDPRLLERAIGELQRLTKQEPDNPAPLWALAQAQSHMAQLLDSRELFAVAADTTLAAIERGYGGSPVIRQLLSDAMAAESEERVRAALAIVVRDEIVLDVGCVGLVVSAVRGFADRGRPEHLAAGRAILERARRHHTKPEQQRELDQIARLLGPE